MSMIIGIGTDVVYIPRIEKIYERYGHRFVKKILTVQEQEYIKAGNVERLCRHIAKRFAAKEALVKAIGTGFSNNISLQDIAIFNDKMGKPFYTIS